MTSGYTEADRRLAAALAATTFSPHGAVLVRLPDGNALGFTAAWGDAADELMSTGLRIPLQSIAGRAIQRREASFVEDAQTSREHYHITDRLTGIGTGRLLALPMAGPKSQGVASHVLELVEPTTETDLQVIEDLVRMEGFVPVGWGSAAAARPSKRSRLTA